MGAVVEKRVAVVEKMDAGVGKREVVGTEESEDVEVAMGEGITGVVGRGGGEEVRAASAHEKKHMSGGASMSSSGQDVLDGTRGRRGGRGAEVRATEVGVESEEEAEEAEEDDDDE